mmetsp:Transcript_2733/g.3141  ORF Transcript_2733/g.3141 Transcript_2733/m.3141 type:complete len:128 (-) Transcript_2733:317-700(-)|eukprot:CAMPEP_0195300878 /NCGR_PEP_ID=MMETSP0707-20130614/28336_1 /TAXON_ID=33640 /ORGANISM="Asterionellopsis glacialis, Strain CCMP134" /LENGTH=127 /DNA_ID=CAMNT_0040363699 /DNA_START=87 /DNA_END=470 /DNA_ORIENTATION=+
MADQKKLLVVLISEGVTDRQQASNQEQALFIIKANKTPYHIVNGMDPNERERRNQLFEVSKIRGNYPQFFFIHQDGSTHYIGNFDEIQNVNETSNLPKDILDQNPNILTWERVFGNVVENFGKENVT